MSDDYLKELPNDSQADRILCQMLPDYKAEVRRTHRLNKREGDPDWEKLPIISAAEKYLKHRLEVFQKGKAAK